MEDQHAHAKRKHYDVKTYALFLADLTQVMNDVPKLRPDRDAWDIEGDWAATGTIYFVDSTYQPLFDPLRDFDCRTIKLVNMDRPAVRITFYRKHRYWLQKDKDLPVEEKAVQIQTYINELTVKAKVLQTKLSAMTAHKRAEISGQIAHCWQRVQVWQEILAAPDEYEMAASNYSRQHLYVTANYKYRLSSGDYTNEQEHLLNTQRDRLGNITQLRYNIFFVDSAQILREHPYQNRETEQFLAGFPIQSEIGKHALYARPRAKVVTS